MLGLSPVVWIVLIAIPIGIFVSNNPLWIGQSVVGVGSNMTSSSSFAVVTEHRYLDAILDSHKVNGLEMDYVPYRNHCLRVLSFAQYFYSAYHPKKESIPSQRSIDVMAIALAYHDLDLWMKDGHLNYLQPSADLARNELQQKQDEFNIEPPLSDTEYAIINEIILQHHKLTWWNQTLFVSLDTNNDDDDDATIEVHTSSELLVNAVRMGDWSDFTLGLIRYGLPPEYLEIALNHIPEAGFHMVLFGMGPRLSPNSLLGQLDVLKILKW